MNHMITKKTKLIVNEMIDLLSLDLVDKRYKTNQLILNIRYDVENLSNPKIRDNYFGEISTDHYGRKVPKDAHGTINLKYYSSSTKKLLEAIMKLYDQIINKSLLVRGVNISANNLIEESIADKKTVYKQWWMVLLLEWKTNSS